MECLVEVEYDAEAGEYVAFCDELRAVASGATEEEALGNLAVAIEKLLREYGEEATC
jgi:predicted RNase H-like HicB family nuclease